MKKEYQSIVNDQDSVWKEIEAYKIQYEDLYHRKREILSIDEFAILKEYYWRKIRSIGIDFWKRYPNDIRKYNWLTLTLILAPDYYDFQLKQFNNDDKRKWETVYPLMKKEYFNYVSILNPKEEHVNDIFSFKVSELSSELNQWKFVFKMTGKKLPLDRYADSIINLVRQANNHILMSFALRPCETVLRDINSYGLSTYEVKAFLQKLKNAGIPELSAWCDGKNQIMLLKETPLVFSFTTYDGEQINMDQFKGKVVLIDFWATWCSSCLDYMPTIKAVYDKYPKGTLNVLSVSINKRSEMANVLSVEKRFKLSWPLGVIGDAKLKNEIWKKFGFTSVPQLILIGKDGKLIEFNGRLMQRNTLDELIHDAL